MNKHSRKKIVKHDEPIFEKQWIQEALKIYLWEMILLWFIPLKKVETEESIIWWKTLWGKFYLINFQMKELYPN